MHAQTSSCCTKIQEQNINQASGNGQYKRRGRASIYSHGGIANIRTWLEALQAPCLSVRQIEHKNQSRKHSNRIVSLKHACLWCPHLSSACGSSSKLFGWPFRNHSKWIFVYQSFERNQGFWISSAMNNQVKTRCWETQTAQQTTSARGVNTQTHQHISAPSPSSPKKCHKGQKHE